MPTSFERNSSRKENKKTTLTIPKKSEPIPEIVMISEFQQLLNPNNDLTNAGQYFDHAIQGRYLDYIALQSSNNNSALLTTFNDVSVGLEKLILFKDKTRSLNLFNEFIASLEKILIDINFLDSKDQILQNRIEFLNGNKTYIQFINLIQYLYMNPFGDVIDFKEAHQDDEFIKKYGTYLNSYFDAYRGLPFSGLYYQDNNLGQKSTKNAYIDSMINDDRITSKIITNLDDIPFKPCAFNLFNNPFVDFDFTAYAREGYTNIDDYDPYLALNAISKILFYNLKNLQISETAFNFGVSDSENTGFTGIRSLSRIFETNIQGMSNNEVMTFIDGDKKILEQIISSMTNKGKINPTLFLKFKEYLNSTISEVEKLRDIFDLTTIPDDLSEYITNPVDKILKTITDPSSTGQNIVFSRNQLSNDFTSAEAGVLGMFAAIKTIVEGDYNNNIGSSNNTKSLWNIYGDRFQDLVGDSQYKDDYKDLQRIPYKMVFFELLSTLYQSARSGGSNEAYNAFLAESLLGSQKGDARSKNRYFSVLQPATKEKFWYQYDGVYSKGLKESLNKSQTWSSVIKIFEDYIKILDLLGNSNNISISYENVFIELLRFILLILGNGTFKIAGYAEPEISGKSGYFPLLALSYNDNPIKNINNPKNITFISGKVELPPATETTQNVDLGSVDLRVLTDEFYKGLLSLDEKIKFLEDDLINANFSEISNITKYFEDDVTSFIKNDVQLNSMRSKLADYRDSFNVVINNFRAANQRTNLVSILDGSMILSNKLKNFIIKEVGAWPTNGDILSIGLPRNFYESLSLISDNFLNKNDVIKIRVNSYDELKKDEFYTQDFYFDLSLFPVWNPYSNINEDLKFRKFNDSLSDLAGEVINISKYVNKTAKAEVIDNIKINHKNSYLIDLYLMMMTNMQVDERSCYDSTMSKVTKLSPGENVISSATSEGTVEFLLTAKNKFDRLFHVFIPRENCDTSIMKYQVILDP